MIIPSFLFSGKNPVDTLLELVAKTQKDLSAWCTCAMLDVGKLALGYSEVAS